MEQPKKQAARLFYGIAKHYISHEGEVLLATSMHLTNTEEVAYAY